MTTRQLRDKVGKRIKEEREARNMSVEELANLLNISTSYLNLIERGERGTVQMRLYRLSQIFGLPIDALFDGKKKTGITAVESRRNKLVSITNDMSEKELECLISAAKGLRGLRPDVAVDDGDDE